MADFSTPAPTALRVRHAALRETIRRALVAQGVGASIAQVESQIMSEADLMGTPSHGVRMLAGLLQALRAGRVNPSPHVRLTREFAATCVLEGDRGPGRFVSRQAMDQAVERAGRFGVGVCLATNTSHWGRAHAYARHAAQAGMIGLCTTNTLPCLSAFGSPKPVLGNNPLAIAVPRGAGREPVVLDIAMTQAAVGKIETYRREGRKTPLDWGLDSAGQPTDDPAAILASRRFLPMGGHKGAGLSLMLEMLTGVLAGGVLSCEMPRVDPSGADGYASKIFLALRPEAFGDGPRFEQRVEEFLDYLRQAAGGESPDTVTYPGQRGERARDRYLAEGIPIDAKTVADLAAIGVTLDAIK